MWFQKIQTQLQLTHLRCYLNTLAALNHHTIITTSTCNVTGHIRLHIYSLNKEFMCDVNGTSLNFSSSW